MQNKDHASPWGEPLKLLPLLALFAAYAVTHNLSYLRGDESRYLLNAHNILKGYFASEETLMFWNGPGYPLYLAPFVALKAPLLLPRLGNTVFLYFGMAYFQGALRLAGVEKRSLIYAYLMGILLLLHGAVVDMLMTESLCVFLICGATYHFFRLAAGDGRNGLHLASAGSLLGYLVWTKVFFGYAIEVSLVSALAFWAWSRWGRWNKRLRPHSESASQAAANAKTAAKAVAVCAVAMAVCVPYLAYTRAITGKSHFWGNSGGLQLYCLTVPEKELTGDWLNFDAVRDYPEFFGHETDVFKDMARLDYIPRDEAFKKAALANLKAYPRKCFWNWRANVNRLVFGFPVSPYPGSDLELTTGNRSFFYALPFLLFLFALVPGWLGRRWMPIEAHISLAFALISLGGLTLLSCIPRQAFPLLPLLGLWSILVVERTLVFEAPWKRAIPADAARLP